MTIVGQEKPDMALMLAHHGVKGMRWGVRKDKPTTADIHNARARVGSQVRTINNQIDKTNLASGKQQKVEAKKLADMHKAFLKNPDRATALRMTTGEKYVAALAAVVLPGVGTAAVGITTASRVAQRKGVESYLRDQGIKTTSRIRTP